MKFVKLAKRKWILGVDLIKRTGLVKGIFLSIGFFLYNLKKQSIIKKKNKKDFCRKLFNGKLFCGTLRDSGLSFDIFMKGIREPVATKRIISLLQGKENDVFLDLGANLGYYSVILGDYFNKIVCVEPNRQAFNFLQKNIKANKLDLKTNLVNKAVHFKGQKLYMKESPEFNLSQVSEEKGDYELDVILFSDLIDKYNPSFLKMDVEGFEYPLFLQSKLLNLKNKFPKFIFIEIHLEMGSFAKNVKFLKLIKELGYKIDSAIWEDDGMYYLKSRFWKGMNKIVRKSFVRTSVIARNMDIKEFIVKHKSIVKGRAGAIEFIFEKN